MQERCDAVLRKGPGALMGTLKEETSMLSKVPEKLAGIGRYLLRMQRVHVIFDIKDRMLAG